MTFIQMVNLGITFFTVMCVITAIYIIHGGVGLSGVGRALLLTATLALSLVSFESALLGAINITQHPGHIETARVTLLALRVGAAGIMVYYLLSQWSLRNKE